jgi:hypothetical protein
VLFEEEIGVPRENHRSAAVHLQILSHNVVSSASRHERMLLYCAYMYNWGCRGHDRMVVGFITTYAISAYHH